MYKYTTTIFTLLNFKFAYKARWYQGLALAESRVNEKTQSNHGLLQIYVIA